MDRLLLIYNPNSGNRDFKNRLDVCIDTLQQGGFEVSLFRTGDHTDIDSHLKQVGKYYSYIVASGGDGTVNLVVNAMMRHEIPAVLGIIPSGTANDFATYLGFSGLSLQELCKTFCERNIHPVDVGRANDRYFINVCGGGLLPQVSQMVDPNLKGILGKMSYYITGIAQLPNFYPLPIRLTTDEGETLEEKVFFFLVLNSPGAGSFDNIVKYAKITDGKLDFLAIKASALHNVGRLLVNVFKGEHLEDPGVLYRSSGRFQIEVLSDEAKYRLSDVDGEDGPDLPLDVQVIPNAIRLLAKV